MKMRRVFIALLICVVAMPCVQAKSNKAVKAVVSRYTKGGYEPYGAYSMFTLTELVERARTKIDVEPERYTAIEGIGEGGDLSSSKMFALNNAATQYATAAGSKVSGQMASSFSNLSEDARTKIVGAYVQKVSEFVMPSLKESYTVARREGKKMLVITSYLVDEQLAKESRERAMNDAVKVVAKEVALEQSFLDSVNQMVEGAPDIE